MPVHRLINKALLSQNPCGSLGTFSLIASSVAGVCPPVAEHSQAEQAKAAEEELGMPEESVVVEMPSDHAAVREQALPSEANGDKPHRRFPFSSFFGKLKIWIASYEVSV
ncbi:MAG: hypothetical protein ACE5DK_11730 [Paracoccaceae bacterium]